MKLDKRVLREAGNVRQYLFIVAGLGTIAGLLVVSQAYLLSQVVNGAFLVGSTISQLWPLLVGLLVVFVGRSLISWASEIVGNRAAEQVKGNLRKSLYQRLLQLGPGYTRGERSGELTNTLTSGVEALDGYFSQYLPQMFLTVIIPLMVLVATFATDLLSGIVLLLTAPILPFFMALVGWAAEAKAKQQFKSLSLLSAHFLDVLQGLPTLKLLGRSQAQTEIIGRISERFRKTTMSVLQVAFLSSLVMELGATLSTAIIAVEIGLRLLYSQISFEAAFFVLLLAPEFYLPIRALGTKYHAGMAGSGASKRIADILDTPLPNDNTLPVTQVPSKTGPQIIRFEGVSFRYPNQEQLTLENITFEIKPGQKVALVGPTGSGKSTLASVLLRFNEPYAGQIWQNDNPITLWSAAGWRKNVAVVPQNPYLFNKSVADNIRLAKPEATLEEVVQAARLANAHEFILGLPQGYNTLIGERGARLSGGQAQRLSLARAFLKNTPLLILDEATSNLDFENQALIMEATRLLMLDRTTLIITHRLSTVRDADQIFVLENGRIVDFGNHAALLQTEGVYQDLLGVRSEVRGVAQ